MVDGGWYTMGGDIRWDSRMQVTEGVLNVALEFPLEKSAVVEHPDRVQERSECDQDRQAG